MPKGTRELRAPRVGRPGRTACRISIVAGMALTGVVLTMPTFAEAAEGQSFVRTTAAQQRSLAADAVYSSAKSVPMSECADDFVPSSEELAVPASVSAMEQAYAGKQDGGGCPPGKHHEQCPCMNGPTGPTGPTGPLAGIARRPAAPRVCPAAAAPASCVTRRRPVAGHPGDPCAGGWWCRPGRCAAR